MKAKVKNDLSQKFSKGTIWTHWISALLIIILILASLKIAGFEKFTRHTIVKIHLFIGSAVILFTILRTIFFFKDKQPEHLRTGSKFVDKLAVWNHYSFYILLFALSISGIMIIVNGHYIDFAKSGNIELITKTSALKYHVLFALLVVLMLLLHLLGVIKHYIFTKENTLKRII